MTYIDQFCRDTGCLLNDLPPLLQDRDRWRDGLMNALARPNDNDDDDEWRVGGRGVDSFVL